MHEIGDIVSVGNSEFVITQIPSRLNRFCNGNVKPTEYGVVSTNSSVRIKQGLVEDIVDDSDITKTHKSVNI